jgi:dihydroflavonol-4-reductase
LLVVVTGGTGYVGSHAIAALAKAGHQIRVLARSPDTVPAALTPLGVDRVDTVTGDVTDSDAVERALEGADAVLHAASVFSMDPRRADEMRAVNVRGTDTVLDTGSASIRLFSSRASSRSCLRPRGRSLLPTRR